MIEILLSADCHSLLKPEEICQPSADDKGGRADDKDGRADDKISPSPAKEEYCIESGLGQEYQAPSRGYSLFGRD